MNEDLRDRRRVELVERLLATRDLLADALAPDTPAPTHCRLAQRVAADCMAIYLSIAAEALGIPFLRSIVIAKSKLRASEIEPQTAEFLEQIRTVAGVAQRSAEMWSSPNIPDDRRRYLFASLASAHQSFVQTVAVIYDDPALGADAADLHTRAKAIAAEIGPAPKDAAA